MSSAKTTSDTTFANRYIVREKIGAGSFGRIYAALDKLTRNRVAIKLESVAARHPQVLYEAKVYNHLRKCLGIPEIHWCGSTDQWHILVMDLLGPSLEDLLNAYHRSFSLKTVLLVAEQLVVRLQTIHGKDFIHRDVKPDNFVLGRGDEKCIIYAIDFGLAKKYMCATDGRGRQRKHIMYREGKNLTGTARYASIATHCGHEQSRRDDLEGLGYVLIYCKFGVLPWQGLKGSTKKAKYDRIREKKLSTDVEALCADLPSEFQDFMNYCYQLRFTQDPDYNYLRNLFLTCLSRHNMVDLQFDWLVRKSSEATSQRKQQQLLQDKLITNMDSKNNNKTTQAAQHASPTS
jgi:serine/threonine protein kinase